MSTTTLIVQHNLSEANLIHADRMGGIPVPSLAIVNKDHPLTKFGEITLLGEKKIADPKGYAKTKVFGADIYSPRYPEVNYKFTQDIIKQAESMLKEGMEATGVSYIDLDQNTSRDVSNLANSSPFMWQFLKDKGIEPQVLKITPKPLPEALESFAESDMDFFDLQRDPVFIEAACKAYEDMLVATNKKDSRDEAKQEIEKIKASNNLNYIVRNYARDVEKFRRDKASAGAIDREKTRLALKKQIYDAGLQYSAEESARAFIKKLDPEEYIFQGFTNTGKRRYVSHTLENVVKILKKELRGGESFNYGVGSIRSKFTPQFKSIEQIRKSKGRLVDAEKFARIRKDIDNEMMSLSQQLSPYHRMGNTLEFGDTVTSVMYDAATMGIPRALKENGFNDVPVELQRDLASFLKKLVDLPTEYFEAKILRNVDISEFSAAVVPDDISKEALNVLNKHGITNIAKYASNNEEDRRAKIAQMADDAKLLFSKTESDFKSSTMVSGKTVSDFKHLVDEVNAKLGNGYEVVLVQSEKDLPTGVQVLYQAVYHGSPYNFDKFDLKHIGTGEGGHDYGWGLYFAERKDVAEWYRKTYATSTEYSLIKDGKDLTSFKWFVNSGISQAVIDFVANDLSYGNVDGAKETLRRYIDRVNERIGTPNMERGDIRKRNTYIKLLQLINDGKLEGRRRHGQLYKVEIPDDTYLLWDKPLREQSDKVQQLLGGKFGIKLDDGNWVVYVEIGREQVPLSVYQGTEEGRKFANEYLQHIKDYTGEEIYYELSNFLINSKSVSKYLHELGINGIKYLDEFSRNAGEGTYNYVIFDDNAIQILERYYSQKTSFEGRPNSRVIEGAYFGGKKVYIVADAIRTEQRFNEVLQHELHHLAGKMTIDSDEYQCAIKSILIMEKKGNKIINDLAFEVDRRQPGLDEETRAKEIMALAAETGLYKKSHLLVRLFANIVRTFKRFAQKIGIKSRATERMGIEEVFSMMRSGERALYLDMNKQLQQFEEYAPVYSANPFDGIETPKTELGDKIEIEVDGVMRPTLNSKGKPIHWSEEGIRNFWRWFGDSKFVDVHGRPMVIYHGTNQDFSEFDPEQSRKKDGIVFTTPNSRIASNFAMYRSTWNGANVMPVYIKAGKVLEIQGEWRDIRDVENDIKIPGMKYGDDVYDYAAKQGYDAIVFHNVRDQISPDIDPVDDVYALFPSSQIKSAIGNAGSFDLHNSNILKSVMPKLANDDRSLDGEYQCALTP